MDSDVLIIITCVSIHDFDTFRCRNSVFGVDPTQSLNPVVGKYVLNRLIRPAKQLLIVNGK